MFRRISACFLIASLASPCTAATGAANNAASPAATAQSGDLEHGFAQPPLSARPRVYWWWLESYLDRAGITRDLEEMERKGIGGALIFDAGSGARYSTTVTQTPCGPPFMSPAWRALFRHALQEADRLGLEISLNMGSGWDCGGPWVTPEYASQDLVWSETIVTGPAKLSTTLPIPPRVRTDLPGFPPYYRDVALLAVPQSGVKAEPPVRATASSEEASWVAANAVDGDLATLWVSKPIAPENLADGKHREWLQLEYPQPHRASALFIAAQEGYGPYLGQLQCRDRDGQFAKLSDFVIAQDEPLDGGIPRGSIRLVSDLVTSAIHRRRPSTRSTISIDRLRPALGCGLPSCCSTGGKRSIAPCCGCGIGG